MTTDTITPERYLIAAVGVVVASTPWPGTTGGTDRRTLEAFLEIANAANSTVVTVSCRQIAEKIGVQYQTVQRSIRRLVDHGWLYRTLPSRGVNAAHYAISLEGPVDTNEPLTRYIATSRWPSNGSFLSNELIRSAHPDTFRSGGLCTSALLVFANLPPSPTDAVSIAVLAELTGKCRRTVKRALTALQQHELAFEHQSAWFRLDGPPNALRDRQAEIARDDLCTAGLTERQRERHEAERRQQLRRRLLTRSGEYFLGEDERHAALPAASQDLATDLAQRAAEIAADDLADDQFWDHEAGRVPFTFYELRRRAFRFGLFHVEHGSTIEEAARALVS